MARLSAGSNSQPELDDRYLVALAKEGHTDAYDAIVRRYRGFVRLKASSYFLAGGDADDLIQEGLLGLYKAVRDYRTDRESSFRNFAELCITRQIITAVKTATRNKHTPLNQYVSFAQTPAAAGDSETTLDEILPGPDGPRPGQPGDRHRRAGEPRLLPLGPCSPTSRAASSRLYLDGHSYEAIGRAARVRHQDGRQRPPARQAQGRSPSRRAQRGGGLTGQPPIGPSRGSRPNSSKARNRENSRWPGPWKSDDPVMSRSSSSQRSASTSTCSGVWVT